MSKSETILVPDQSGVGEQILSETPEVLTQAQFLEVLKDPAKLEGILQEIAKNIPMLKQAIQALSTNPLLLPIISKLFPNLAPILPALAQLGPILDFLLSLDQEILKALKSS